VAGAGALGVHHIRWLRSVDGAHCAGFFDTDTRRASQVSDDLGVRAYASLDELLDACDALCVVVPTPAHAAVALAAIRRGKHLLVEKPLTATVGEADELLSAARAAGVVVQTGHIERFNRAIRAALPFIDNPRFISSERLAPFKQRGTEVPVVLDLMIHDIDLILTLTGARVADVQAVGVPVLSSGADMANARIVFEGGAVATVSASRMSLKPTRKLRLFQRNGYFSLDLAAGKGSFYSLKEGFDPSAVIAGTASLESLVDYVKLKAPKSDSLQLELQSFVDAVRGKGTVAVTGEDGRAALIVAHRIMTAIEVSLGQNAASIGRA
jgi:predicted dehydrogenase